MAGYFKDLIESGGFKPVIDRRYPLDEIVEAYRYVETGQKTGMSSSASMGRWTREQGRFGLTAVA